MKVSIHPAAQALATGAFWGYVIVVAAYAVMEVGAARAVQEQAASDAGEWVLPAVRGHFVATLEMAAVAGAEGASTTTLQSAFHDATPARRVALLAGLRAAGAEQLLGPEALAAAESEAAVLAADADTGHFGSLFAALAMEDTGIADLLDRVTDNLRADDVPGNALVAMELLRAGLRTAPHDTVAALERILDEDRTAGGFKRQEAIMAANLYLYAALAGDRDLGAPGATWYADRADVLEPPRRDRVVARGLDMGLLEDICIAYARGGHYWQDSQELFDATRGNRSRAWYLVEHGVCASPRVLGGIPEQGYVKSMERKRLLACWLLHHPEKLAEPGYRETLLYFGAPPSGFYPGTFADWLGAETTAERDKENSSVLYWLYHDPPGDAVERLTEARGFAPRYVELLHAELPGLAGTQRGLTLAWTMTRIGHEPSLPACTDIALANLVDDDVIGNAISAGTILGMSGQQGISAALTGLQVAASVEDWQLAERCAEFLHSRDVEVDYAELPELLAFMAEQLRDDDVAGNATGAVCFFQVVGAAGRPALEAVEQSDDPQQARIARQLLAQVPVD